MEPAIGVALREVRRSVLNQARQLLLPAQLLKISDFHSSSAFYARNVEDAPTEEVGRTGTGSSQVSTEQDSKGGGEGDVPPESTFDAGGSFHMQEGKHDKKVQQQNFDQEMGKPGGNPGIGRRGYSTSTAQDDSAPKFGTTAVKGGGPKDGQPEELFTASGHLKSVKRMKQGGLSEKLAPQHEEAMAAKGGGVVENVTSTRGYCTLRSMTGAPRTGGLLFTMGYCAEKPHIERERAVTDTDFMKFGDVGEPPRDTPSNIPPPGGMSHKEGKSFVPGKSKGHYKGVGEEGDNKTGGRKARS